MEIMFNCTTLVNIPAYDSDNNGLIIEFKLTATSSNKFLINTRGKVAEALQRNFKRIIEIMSSMKSSWEYLESFNYLLECNSDQFIVRDSKSSSMALSIALLNINRVKQGKTLVSGLTGTGVLRIDGSFDCSHLEEKKYNAAKNFKSINKFITPKVSKNLFELENFINQIY